MPRVWSSAACSDTGTERSLLDITWKGLRGPESAAAAAVDVAVMLLLLPGFDPNVALGCCVAVWVVEGILGGGKTDIAVCWLMNVAVGWFDIAVGWFTNVPAGWFTKVAVGCISRGWFTAASCADSVELVPTFSAIARRAFRESCRPSIAEGLTEQTAATKCCPK